MRTILRFAAVAAVGVMMVPVPVHAGGGGFGPCPNTKGRPGQAIVEVIDACFLPRAVTVSTGGAVTWRLGREVYMGHTVTAADGAFDTGEDLAGPFTVRFDHPGTYFYSCVYHPGMTGRVVVEGPSLGGTDPVSELEVAGSEDPVAEAERRLADVIASALLANQPEPVRAEPAAARNGLSGAAVGGVWAGAAAIAGMVAMSLRARGRSVG